MRTEYEIRRFKCVSIELFFVFLILTQHILFLNHFFVVSHKHFKFRLEVFKRHIFVFRIHAKVHLNSILTVSAKNHLIGVIVFSVVHIDQSIWRNVFVRIFPNFVSQQVLLSFKFFEKLSPQGTRGRVRLSSGKTQYRCCRCSWTTRMMMMMTTRSRSK